jgi:GYF domain 2
MINFGQDNPKDGNRDLIYCFTCSLEFSTIAQHHREMDINQSLKYHCSRVGQKFGPFTGAELVQLARGRQLLPTDHIWTEGMSGWESASAFSSLTPIFAANHPSRAHQQTGHQTRPVQTRPEYDPGPVENPIAAQITGRVGLPGKSGAAADLALLHPKTRKRRGASFGFLLFVHRFFGCGGPGGLCLCAARGRTTAGAGFFAAPSQLVLRGGGIDGFGRLY